MRGWLIRFINVSLCLHDHVHTTRAATASQVFGVPRSFPVHISSPWHIMWPLIERMRGWRSQFVFISVHFLIKPVRQATTGTARPLLAAGSTGQHTAAAHALASALHRRFPRPARPSSQWWPTNRGQGPTRPCALIAMRGGRVPLWFYFRSTAKSWQMPFGFCHLILPKAGQCQWGFIKNFIILNIINFTDMPIREKDGVSWNVRRVSLP